MQSRKPKRYLTAFISFSEADHRLVHSIATALAEIGVQHVIASQQRSPGTRLDEKVRKLIVESHAVVVVLTTHGVSSRWVQQEIGTARTLDKRIIVLKTRGVKMPVMLEGIEYLPLSNRKPQAANRGALFFA